MVAEYSLKRSKLETWSVDRAVGKLKMVEYSARGGQVFPKIVPVVTRDAIDDQAPGMGPHRLGFPERSSEVRELSVDQPSGIED